MIHVEYKESVDFTVVTVVCSGTSGKKFACTFFTHELHM